MRNADVARRDERSSIENRDLLASTNALGSTRSMEDFSIQEYIGQGSTAQVYMATRAETNEYVAIKAIDKRFLQKTQMELKVHREISLHSPLRHRHVVRLYETFENAQYYFLVLEYCPGGSVASRIRSLGRHGTTLDQSEVKKVFQQTAVGVSYLHAHGIIHRDLKLSNLLLTADDDIKISDFGLATLMSDDHVTVCGTPNFIAPEVLSSTSDSLSYDETVDIWSLGCILYTLTVGRPPFEGSKVSDTLINVSNAGRQPLYFPEGFSATIADLINRMLNRDAVARPNITQVLAHPWLQSTTDKSAQLHKPERRSENLTLETLVTATTGPRRAKILERTRRRSAGRGRSVRLPTKSNLTDKNCEGPSDSSSDVDPRRVDIQSNSSCEADEDSLQISSEQLLLSDISMDLTFAEHLKPRPSLESETDRHVQVHSEEGEAIDSSNQLPCSLSGVDLNPTSTGASDVHFLRVCIQVSNLQFLGIAPDSTREIHWDCWESSDIRQLTRFTLRVGGADVEYIPSKGLIQGVCHDGSLIRHDCCPLGGARSSMSPSGDLERLVRLCQCLALRSLQLRRAAMATDVDNLPMVHYDRLPDSVLESLRKEDIRTTVYHQLGHTRSLNPNSGTSASCVLPGVGLGELNADGRLTIHFFSGPMLQMNASASTIRYRPGPSELEDEFDLSNTPYLPTEVKKHFEHAPNFIRQLKFP